MRIRAFLAVPFEPEIQERISELSCPIREQTSVFRWVKDENLHLTLRFFESVEESKISAMREALGRKLREFPCFKIVISGFGAFPDFYRPRVLWIGIKQGSEESIRLKSSVDDALVSLGFPKEAQSFVPHITVGRLKMSKRADPGLEPVASSIMSSVESEARGLVLFKSELAPSGPVYSELFRIDLGRSPV